jgi:hypothetical protein
MHDAGVFQSVSEARKNGWNKPIEAGYSSYRVGKNKLLVCIFKEL